MADASRASPQPGGSSTRLGSEHLASTQILDEMAFPRPDTVADRGWTGEVRDVPATLAARAAWHPRITT